MPPEDARTVWDALIVGGSGPAGLGARDTLRLEVNYCLYGNDLTEERNPIEAGLGWCVKEETGFIGSEAVPAGPGGGPWRAPRALRDDRSRHPPPGQSDPGGRRAVGEVTSGTMSPSLEVGIGMGYVRADLAEPGTGIEIDVRGKLRPAEIRERPLYSKD